MPTSTYQRGDNPIFDKFDDELHAVVEKYRKAHPDWWFSYSGARADPMVKQVTARSKHDTKPLPRPSAK